MKNSHEELAEQIELLGGLDIFGIFMPMPLFRMAEEYRNDKTLSAIPDEQWLSAIGYRQSGEEWVLADGPFRSMIQAHYPDDLPMEDAVRLVRFAAHEMCAVYMRPQPRTATKTRETAVKEFVTRQKETYPDSEETILRFIAEILMHNECVPTAIDNIHNLFQGGYCYYFAKMLEDAFPGGTVCQAAPFEHIIYQKNGICYDIEGVYNGEAERFIPVIELKEAVNNFRHIPRQASEEE